MYGPGFALLEALPRKARCQGVLSGAQRKGHGKTMKRTQPHTGAMAFANLSTLIGAWAIGSVKAGTLTF